MTTEKSKNEILAKLPERLKQYIVAQNYEHYTPINHAVWRYVMRANVNYLSEVAHPSYMDGLKSTGIGTENIPSIEEMNEILKKIGWAAVAVDGFIPPDIFMEFQAFNILVIAADIRQIEHIEHTPAPDIIHESAGHAPIIANPDYAEFLRRFGEIGCKAISSAKDFELFEAIRHLSLIKEKSGTSEEAILAAEKEIKEISDNMGEPSEMARIKNLHWFSVEYGLIGTLEDPKIYGAGLLSSIGESKWCLTDDVEKMPFTIATADMNYDITKPQPLLFVTPNFPHLSFVLEEFANTMAVRKGGLKGVEKLIASENMGTIELSTGLQVSGIFTNVIDDGNYNPIYVQTTGNTALAYREKELIGHGTSYHADGFGSPIGKLKSINLAIEDMSPKDLQAYGIYEGKEIELVFEGEVSVKGEIITGVRNLQGKIILISFKNCTVTHREKILFQPEWGIYDMAVGKNIVSAFSGPASYNSFDNKAVNIEPTVQEVSTGKQKELEDLYAQVRTVRETNNLGDIDTMIAKTITSFANEWLLPLEIIELCVKESERYQTILAHLEKVKKEQPNIAHLIENGLLLL